MLENNIREKLNNIRNRYECLTMWFGQPEAMNDMELYTKNSVELSEIEEMAEQYKIYLEKEQYLYSLQNETVADEEMKELVKDEIKSVNCELADIAERLMILLIPEDENDNKNVIVEVHSGIGGDEGCLFAQDLFTMIGRYVTKSNWDLGVAYMSEDCKYGIKEATLTVKGKGAYSKLKHLSGVIRVQRVPKTESKGRIQTSCAAIYVYPERSVTEVNIRPEDLEMSVCRSGGAGGQHLNKTSSCVELTHIPTGITVRSQAERSQLQNKENCMKMLATKLYEYYNNPAEAEFFEAKGDAIADTERSQKIITFDWSRSAVKDHRLNKDFNLDKILAGDLDEMLSLMVAKENAENLIGEA